MKTLLINWLFFGSWWGSRGGEGVSTERGAGQSGGTLGRMRLSLHPRHKVPTVISFRPGGQVLLRGSCAEEADIPPFSEEEGERCLRRLGALRSPEGRQVFLASSQGS